MERPFSSKVIDAVYSGYSGDHFDPDAAIDAVLELLPEPTVEEVAHAIYDCTGLNRAVPEDAREIAIAVLALIGGRTAGEYVPPKPILDAPSTGNRLVLKNEEGTVILSSRPLCREHEWIEERTISRQYDRKTCTVCGLETNGSGSVFTLEFSSLE